MRNLKELGQLMAVGVCGFAAILVQAADPAKPRVIVSELTEIKAKVDSVDQTKRLVTFSDAKGDKVTVKAGPAVKNLDQVKAGDELVVKYFESIALFIRKGAEPPSATETGAVAVAAKGQEPAAIAVDTFEYKAKVEAVHPVLRSLTLIGVDGKKRHFKVHEDFKAIADIKKGDELIIRHTDALAVSIEKAK